ncbi:MULTISPECIES: hypothetical protein [unclassified Bacillus cereus group]|nr:MULTISPECIES: hypothetical protein [unclassified Bacillus cereus group]
MSTVRLNEVTIKNIQFQRGVRHINSPPGVDKVEKPALLDAGW